MGTKKRSNPGRDLESCLFLRIDDAEQGRYEWKLKLEDASFLCRISSLVIDGETDNFSEGGEGGLLMHVGPRVTGPKSKWDYSND